MTLCVPAMQPNVLSRHKPALHLPTKSSTKVSSLLVTMPARTFVLVLSTSHQALTHDWAQLDQKNVRSFTIIDGGGKVFSIYYTTELAVQAATVNTFIDMFAFKQYRLGHLDCCRPYRFGMTTTTHM